MTDKTPAEMLAELGKPFPPNAIKRKNGKFDYIEHQMVTRRLNSVTPEWSFVIRDTWFRDDLHMTNKSSQPVITLVVLGELTIPGLGTRSGYGVANLQPGGGEDQYKGAESDALKKAASRFGVALDLYGDDYEANTEQPVQRATAAPNAPKPPTPSASTPDPDWKAASDRMHAVGTKHGFAHEELRLICDREERLANKRPITTLKDAPPALLRYVTDLIEKNPANQRAWLNQQAKQSAELLPGMDAVPNPTTANHYTDH